MNNMSLGDVENRLQNVIYRAKDLEFRHMTHTSDYRYIVDEINYLNGLRDQIRNGISYQRQNGYSQYPDPRSQGEVTFHPPVYRDNRSIATPYNHYDSMGYARQSRGTDSSLDNKFASKADELMKPRITVEYPVGNSSSKEPVKNLVAVEGSEYVLNVSNGLECRKEENETTFKYEVYGEPIAVKHPTIKTMSNDITCIDNARKYALENDAGVVFGTIKKSVYSKNDTSAEEVNTAIKNGNVLETFLALNNKVDDIVNYLNRYYTMVHNVMLVTGLKRWQNIDNLFEDLESMEEIINSEPTKVRAYYNNIKNEINTDLTTNVKYTTNDKGVGTTEHSIEFVYIEDIDVLGNLFTVMKEKVCCVKEDSNATLFNVLTDYFKKKKKYFTILYARDSDGVVHKFNVCLDIYNNPIISIEDYI